MKIALIGTGKMGRMVGSLAADKGHKIFVEVDEHDAHAPADQLAQKLRGADVAVDFSSASAILRNVESSLKAGIPLVEGTTGWNERLEQVKQIVTSQNGAFIYGANFSIGVNLFYRIVDQAAELFSKVPDYEVFIEEQHHSRKKDAPSGTALKLKEVVSRHIQGDFSVSATRAGNIPGTHRVGFDGPADQILLQHTARSREGFAAGALLAAEWITGKSGFYQFDQVIESLLSK